jgi:hypothetical protein
MSETVTREGVLVSMSEEERWESKARENVKRDHKSSEDIVTRSRISDEKMRRRKENVIVVT